jgi:GNAT superfamily N-acetyltransferase
MKQDSLKFNSIMYRIRLGLDVKIGYVLVLDRKSIKKVKHPEIELRLEEITHPTDADINALVNIGFYTPTRNDVVTFLAKGHRCFVARYEGKIISCFWALTKEYYDHRLNRIIKFAENEVYCVGAFTLPEYRGKGILDYLYVNAARDYICTDDEHLALAFVDNHNRASLRAVDKMGFKKVGELNSISLFGFSLQYITGRNVLPETRPRILIKK